MSPGNYFCYSSWEAFILLMNTRLFRGPGLLRCKCTCGWGMGSGLVSKAGSDSVLLGWSLGFCVSNLLSGVLELTSSWVALSRKAELKPQCRISTAFWEIHILKKYHSLSPGISFSSTFQFQSLQLHLATVHCSKASIPSMQDGHMTSLFFLTLRL